jgi:hypothetical protein
MDAGKDTFTLQNGSGLPEASCRRKVKLAARRSVCLRDGSFAPWPKRPQRRGSRRNRGRLVPELFSTPLIDVRFLCDSVPPW